MVSPSKEGGATLDLSLETLSDDMIDTIRLTQARLGWEELPPLVLVGHSLGGAVVTDVAKRGVFGDKVLAYAVLDVVEGWLFLELTGCSFWCSYVLTFRARRLRN